MNGNPSVYLTNADKMVSVVCIAYNQEKYIADAIDSFLMQKTDFAYEILIHDDASTDDTANIIRKYESKYPDLIKAIYQEVNQYSQGKHVGLFCYEIAKGKYIAVCEGDDFWTDPNKLQKQVDYMESHPDCSLCVHAAYVSNCDRTKLKPNIRPNHGNKIFTVEEIIAGGGGIFVTNSMMYPAESDKYRPSYFDKSPIGDYPLYIYLATKGTVYYIDEFMSAYRTGVPDSWTSRNSSIDKQISHFGQVEVLLNEINKSTEYQYDQVIKNVILNNNFRLALAQSKYHELKAAKYRQLYLRLNKRAKLVIFIKEYCPFIKYAKRKLLYGKRNYKGQHSS